MAFLGVDKVGKFERVPNEKDGGVVAHQVKVTLFGVELQGKTAHVTFGIGSAAFSCYCGKAQKDGSLLAYFGKEFGLGILAKVMGDAEGAVGAGTLGMDDSFRDALSILVGQFFEKLIVLHKDRTAGTGGKRILVVSDWVAACCGHCLGTHYNLLCLGE